MLRHGLHYRKIVMTTSPVSDCCQGNLVWFQSFSTLIFTSWLENTCKHRCRRWCDCCQVKCRLAWIPDLHLHQCVHILTCKGMFTRLSMSNLHLKSVQIDADPRPIHVKIDWHRFNAEFFYSKWMRFLKMLILFAVIVMRCGKSTEFPSSVHSPIGSKYWCG